MLIGSAFSREVKTAAISAAVLAYTGKAPIITRFPDYNEISFSPDQAAALQSVLASWHDSAPGEIRINIKPVLVPFYFKKYWPYLAGVLLVGLALGAVAFRGGRSWGRGAGLLSGRKKRRLGVCQKSEYKITPSNYESYGVTYPF